MGYTEMTLKVPGGTKAISIVCLVETQLGYEMITTTAPTAFIENGGEIIVNGNNIIKESELNE